ncbi:MAG TPA: hypothetical protein VKS20_01490 [Candidatus Acidoferrales bacterium]|nr:hypothetical protein [Candidatus Acidoferrales bacterium]
MIDAKGLSRELEGKTLRIRFIDGTEGLVGLEMVMIHDCHEDCNGFIYHVLSSSEPQRLTRSGSSYLGRFQDIASWEVIEAAG